LAEFITEILEKRKVTVNTKTYSSRIIETQGLKCSRHSRVLLLKQVDDWILQNALALDFTKNLIYKVLFKKSHNNGFMGCRISIYSEAKDMAWIGSAGERNCPLSLKNALRNLEKIKSPSKIPNAAPNAFPERGAA
jgi:hypothetical protein